MPWIPAATAAASLLLLPIRPLVRLLLVRPLSHPTQLEPPCSATSTCPYWICGFVTKRELKLCQTQNSTTRNKSKNAAKHIHPEKANKQMYYCYRIVEDLEPVASLAVQGHDHCQQRFQRLPEFAQFTQAAWIHGTGKPRAARSCSHQRTTPTGVPAKAPLCRTCIALGLKPLNTMAADTRMEVSSNA